MNSVSSLTVAGARILEPPHDMPFGERPYAALDPAGHRWTFSPHIADVPPEEWEARRIHE